MSALGRHSFRLHLFLRSRRFLGGSFLPYILPLLFHAELILSPIFTVLDPWLFGQVFFNLGVDEVVIFRN